MVHCRATLFFFLITFSGSFAQSAWKSFWKLSSPEKTWVITHPFVAKRAFKITKEAVAVAEIMKSDTTLDGDVNGGQVDAFRHGYWMASLSQKICWRKALSLGRSHEKGNFKMFKKGIKDEEGELPDSVSGAMDLFNNRVGVQIGCENKEYQPDTLKSLIKKAIIEGRMRIICKNKLGQPLDNSGNPLNLEVVKNRWKTPKTLVPSNVQRSDN